MIEYLSSLDGLVECFHIRINFYSILPRDCERRSGEEASAAADTLRAQCSGDWSASHPRRSVLDRDLKGK